MNQKDKNPGSGSAWECIDPTVGTELWTLEVDETSPEQKARLRAHLELCDACRLDQALAAKLASGLADGDLRFPPEAVAAPSPQAWWQRPAVLASTGSALMAACLLLMMVLPPPPTGDDVHWRGGPGEIRFLTPVEGQMVQPGSATLSWTPVKGATSYHITLTAVDEDFVWEGSTKTTELKLPVLDLDSDRHQVRAVLATVPADLVPAGSISVAFRTGRQTDVVRDRLGRAPLWLNLLFIAGLILLAISVWRATRRSRGLSMT